MDTKEKRISGKTLFRGRIVTLEVDSVELPDGGTATREVVRHKPAIGLVPVLGNGNILLVRQYRYATGETLFEIPAGIVEDGEEFLDTAMRELQEETGFKASSLEKIAEFYTSPGFSNELLVVFVAKGLEESKLEPDDDEFIDLVELPPDRVQKMMDDGTIRDGKTFAALSWYFMKERS